MPSRLSGASRRSVGAKQTIKSIEKGETAVVYVARDADPKVTEPVIRLCRELGIELVEIESMDELRHACGIKVGAAAAAILRPTNIRPANN